jgi:isopenicillin N synthase-like dioxygenase
MAAKGVDRIPLIDLGELISSTTSTEDAWNQAAKEIGDACLNIGFFYVKNHGVDKDLIENIFKYDLAISSSFCP